MDKVAKKFVEVIVNTDRCTHYRSNGNIPERRGNHRGDFWRQPADAGRPD